jgi:hypothetical protein
MKMTRNEELLERSRAARLKFMGAVETWCQAKREFTHNLLDLADSLSWLKNSVMIETLKNATYLQTLPGMTLVHGNFPESCRS